MWDYKVFLLFGWSLHSVLGQWSCTQDSQCADVAGSVCAGGACACAAGQQIVNNACVDLAPYHTSACVEHHQCSRLFLSFECRRGDNTQGGFCHCQAGHHYFLGRCWRSAGYGASCTTDEECIGDVIRDPYNMHCVAGTCACAPGYYERQRGECRKIAYDVGDSCVVNEDCQFANGVCNTNSLTCELSSGTTQFASVSRVTSPRANITSFIVTSARANITSPFVTSARANITSPIVTSARANITSPIVTSARANVSTRAHGSSCANEGCDAPFECGAFGACICPVGYYASADGSSCLAELGSVSSEAQCVGFLAEVIDGVCSCPANFFYEENMRDCVKVTRVFTDSCITDENCHTFGAASYCGAPQDPWGLRSCQCDADQAVWDGNRQMCRLFAGVNEMCEADSDCLAGELEIQCVKDESGQGYCVCPDGYITVNGLCLTTGLSIGDACQASLECTEVANTACVAGACACEDSYQLQDGVCAPIIGGVCTEDEDCLIEFTVCRNASNVFTCQCGDGFVAYNETCWPVSAGFEDSCNVTAQCSAAMGTNGVCRDEICQCVDDYHHRDGNCWPITELFEECSRTSECYLAGASERVVCRNSLCQCDFHHPYSEQEQTCISSATSVLGSTIVIISALVFKSIS